VRFKVSYRHHHKFSITHGIQFWPIFSSDWIIEFMACPIWRISSPVQSHWIWLKKAFDLIPNSKHWFPYWTPFCNCERLTLEMSVLRLWWEGSYNFCTNWYCQLTVTSWMQVLMHEGGTLLVCANSVRAFKNPSYSFNRWSPLKGVVSSLTSNSEGSQSSPPSTAPVPS